MTLVEAIVSCRCDERSEPTLRPPEWRDFRYCPRHGVQGEPKRVVEERSRNLATVIEKQLGLGL